MSPNRFAKSRVFLPASAFSQSGIGLFFVGITLAAPGALLALAGTVVLLLAFLAASRRGGAAPSRGAILSAVLTATAGLAGYPATRPLAADARRPLMLL